LFFFLHHFAPPILLVLVLFPKLPWNFELWKMPRNTENAASTKSVDSVEPEERLEFDDDEEEEIEYEEIEEEVEEYEEVEEVDEEEDPEETEPVREADEDEKEKHAELLALPPHGSEVYIGGIASGVSSEDLKKLCESVGEVVEVSTANFLWVHFCICFLLQYKIYLLPPIFFFFRAGADARQGG
jgi:hypothetical protein